MTETPQIDGEIDGELAEIVEASWCAALKVSAVAADDDFFEIGGHSIAVTRIVSYLRRRLDVEVDMLQVWETPVFADFRAAVASLVARRERPAS